MLQSSSKNKQMFRQDRSNLLEDIQKGIQLKSSKHLSSDRSSPLAKGGSLASGINKVHLSSASLKPPNGSAKVDAIYYIPNGPFQNKSGKDNNPLRPSLSSNNISSQKPPILHPKPKLSLTTSISNIERNHPAFSDAPNFKGATSRMSLIDGSDQIKSQDTYVKSTIDFFATMKRSQGQKFLQQNKGIPVERPRSGSFQQNRLVISSLFNNGSASHVAAGKSSSVVQPENVDDVDEIEYMRIGDLQNSSESRQRMTNEQINVAFRHQNNHAQPTSHSTNNHVSRSSRPLPPLPSRPPPERHERNKHTRKSQISFEDRFTFHGEKDFPKPPPFRAHKKLYTSSQKNSTVYWSHRDTKGIPLVTTV